MKRNVIFWEQELGSSLLKQQKALDYGQQLFSFTLAKTTQNTTPVPQNIVTSDELPKITMPTTRIQTPLDDFPMGQSVTKLLPQSRDLPGSIFWYENPAADIERKTAPKRQKPRAMVVLRLR